MKYDVSRLPPDLKQKLTRASTGAGGEEYPALVTEGVVGKWILLFLGLPIVVLPPFYITDLYSLTDWTEVAAGALVCFLGFWMVCTAIGWLMAFRSYAVRPSMVLGPDALVVVASGNGPAEFFPVIDLEKVTVMAHGQFVLAFTGKSSRHFNTGIEKGQVVAFTQTMARRKAELAKTGGDATGESWLASVKSQSEAPVSLGRSGWGRTLATMGVAAVAAFLVMDQAWLFNARKLAEDRYERVKKKDTLKAIGGWMKSTRRAPKALLPTSEFPVSLRDKYRYTRDWSGFVLRRTKLLENFSAAKKRYDDLLFEEAKEADDVKKLRAYLLDTEKPAHADEATALLHAKYDRVATWYSEMAATLTKPSQPIEGMKALLAHLRAGDVTASKVGVHFLPVEGLEGGVIEKKIKDKTGAKMVHPVGKAFDAKANKGRHSRIIRAMNTGMKKVVGDLFELEEVAADAPGPRFLVNYRVIGSGSHYFSKKHAGLPMAQRELYVGIALFFACTVQVPENGTVATTDPKDGYRYGLLATPAMDFSVRGSSYGSFASAVYDKMASTAFTEFETKMAQAFGLDKAPKLLKSGS